MIKFGPTDHRMGQKSPREHVSGFFDTLFYWIADTKPRWLRGRTDPVGTVQQIVQRLSRVTRVDDRALAE